jgi:hypothetical protein
MLLQKMKELTEFGGVSTMNKKDDQTYVQTSVTIH